MVNTSFTSMGRRSQALAVRDAARRRRTEQGSVASAESRREATIAKLTERSETTGSSPVATTTVRPKTQFSDGYFMHNIQKQGIILPKSREKRGFFPQNSTIFLIFGIAILR